MSQTHAVVEGSLQPDGTLVLDQKPDLPPGRVQVMIQLLPEFPKDDPFWQRMQKIWADQKARGHVPRSVEEIEAERRAIRADSELEMREAERLYEQCVRARQQSAPPEQGG
jgi:hypothetical protein